VRVSVEPGQGQAAKGLDIDGAADWVKLFNGKDLTGWTARRCAPGTWKVDNGILVGRDARYGELVTDRGTFENYQLRAEARINAGGDSGVFNRFNLEEDGSGYEVQIGCHDAPRPHTGAVLCTNRGQWHASKNLTQPQVWFT